MADENGTAKKKTVWKKLEKGGSWSVLATTLVMALITKFENDALEKRSNKVEDTAEATAKLATHVANDPAVDQVYKVIKNAIEVGAKRNDQQDRRVEALERRIDQLIMMRSGLHGPPLPPNMPTSPSFDECTEDMDCKGGHVCQSGRCARIKKAQRASMPDALPLLKKAKEQRLKLQQEIQRQLQQQESLD